MAAFQQRRREQRPQLDPSQSTASDDWAQLATSDDDAILLFSPAPRPDTALDSSQWSVLDPPRGRTPRATSWASTASTGTSASGVSDSPSSLAQASLLPAHDGSGVFPAGAQLSGTDAASLIQSDALFPSSYADVAAGDSASDASSAFSHLPPFIRRDSHTSSTFSSFAGSDVSSRASGGWALTEAALSSLPTSGAHRSRGRATAGRVAAPSGNVARDALDGQLADDEDADSAGLTSGSEEGDGQESRPSPGDKRAAIARAAAAQQQDEDDWAHSHLAMSAGILPPSRRRRALPPNSSALSRQSLAAAAAVNIHTSPGIVSSALHSLSLVSSAHSRLSNSSGYKRRHRRAGLRDGESKKRSSAGVVPLHDEYLERIMREEDERASRMQDLLRQRREEEELRLAQDRVLFGSTVRAYMSIEPATLALIAASPTASANPTPTQSRAASPTRLKHGVAFFAEHAARELRRSSFDADDAEDVSDAETEVDAEHAHGLHAQDMEWTSYDAAVPPAASLRATPTPAAPGRPLASTAHRSHSASDLPAHFLRPLSSPDEGGSSTSGGLELVFGSPTPPARPQLMRRRSSYSPTTSAPLSPSAGRDLAHLSHEERILLAPATVTAVSDSSSAWGGELDSFALAIGYWKRLLRRLKEGAGLGLHEGDAAGESVVGGEGGVVRVVEVY